MDNIFDRLFDSYKKSSSIAKKGIQWIAGQGMIRSGSEIFKDREQYEKILPEFSKHYIAGGINAYAYYNTSLKEGSFESIQNYFRYQEAILLKETDIKLPMLYFPKVCNLVGKIIDEKTIVPVAGYRYGYYLYNIKKLLETTKKEKKIARKKNSNQTNIVLEIGGGWGGLAYLMNKHIPNTKCVIVDLPETYVITGYFLHLMGKKVCLYGEYDKFSIDLFDKYDFIIIPPGEVENLPDKIFNIVVSTNCLPELPTENIDIYLSVCHRLLISNKYFYIISESNCNSKYLYHKIEEDKEYEVISNDISKISTYKPYIIGLWEPETENIEIREIILKNLI